MSALLTSTREMLGAIPYLGHALVLAWLVYVLWLCAWIVLQKREPVATLSWVMSLALLPYVGFMVYFLLGPQRIKRQRLRRGRTRSGMARYSDTCPADDACAELSRIAQATTGLPPSSALSAHWLVDGQATYAALLEAIAGARHHIHLEYYIWNPDRTGLRLLDALAERARAGVQVRLLLDAVGSSALKARHLRPLIEAGAAFAWFHPTRFRPFTRPWVNLRTHRKIVVVDGRVGFIGGINVTDEENEAVSGNAYRDLHLRVEGAVVRSLQLAFIEDWIYADACDPDGFGEPGYWPRPEPGPVQAQVLVSGPDSSWEAIHRLHVAAIHEARRRVWLVTPYFVPGEAARMALTSAALGGLDTRLLVPRRSDSRLVTLAARSYFDELIQAGVQVYEYGPRLLHTKALLTDDQLCIVGSANFDHRSFRLNFEASMLLRDADACQALARLLEAEFDAAARVRPDRPGGLWRHRLPESLARLLSPLL
ncbi:cardiolipin synthase [Pseudoxanthomonas broegbernensis]|uniref:Cardiolipin synthase n=1 Tax=Pseudoxanthomonas broegbernensis TaxID=83619 RepID=A0A7V8GN61_9GAMM|nr:cardiolipin synthase [Pseudoxanthomonas broegbernensis]KAF1686822.1 cardiolipin synthase [Pseudoxanthomonas broegbernensis]MBB6065593.1 cardiolipin synthase [Pseudoxanthomonas broegbernensis]